MPIGHAVQLLYVNGSDGCLSIKRRYAFGNHHSAMSWDAKRQAVWLAAGLLLGTFVAYSDAHDEDGTFVPRFFIFMESLVLIIIAVLFYIYSRKKN